jgi:lipid-A-disaccharide synthase-like uncharacterized protein
MDWMIQWLAAGAPVVGAKFLGIEWHFWKVVGWTGNVVFFTRFFVQWWATEKHKQVVVPNVFWWLSLVGALCLLAYGLWRRDSVIIFAYLFVWIPYARNLIISHRVARSRMDCPGCETRCPPRANFCPECGVRLAP